MTQEQIILLYLAELNDWQFEYKIRSMRTPQGFWIGARGDRTVRELIQRGLLEKAKEGRYRIVRYKREKIVLSPAREYNPQQALALHR